MTDSEFASRIDHKALTRIALYYLPAAHKCQAEDIVQDAILKAWKSIASLQDPAHFAGWMRRILFTEAIMFSRKWGKRRVFVSPEEFEVLLGSTPAVVDSTTWRSDFLEQVMSGLTAPHQQALSIWANRERCDPRPCVDKSRAHRAMAAARVQGALLEKRGGNWQRRKRTTSSPGYSH